MLYIFDHIFKTAGTTFNFSYLPGAFEPHEYFVIPGFGEPHRDALKRLSAPLDAEGRRWKLITGHEAGTLRPHYPGARWLTLVRHPADRVISAYLHSKFHPDSRDLIGREIQQDNIGLAEYVERDLHAQRDQEGASVHDWQAKTLLGSEFSTVDFADECAIAEIIRRRFYLAGCTESVEVFLFLLHLADGFPLVLFNNRLVRQEHASFHPSPEDLAVIERYNRRDAIVCRCVRREFDRRLATVWTPGTAAAYYEYIRALRRFRRESGGEINALRRYAPVPRPAPSAAAGESRLPDL